MHSEMEIYGSFEPCRNRTFPIQMNGFLDIPMKLPNLLKLAEDDSVVFQVCEEELPPTGKYIFKQPEGPLIFFDTTALGCSYWNETSEKWTSEGCEVFTGYA